MDNDDTKLLEKVLSKIRCPVCGYMNCDDHVSTEDDEIKAIADGLNEARASERAKAYKEGFEAGKVEGVYLLDNALFSGKLGSAEEKAEEIRRHKVAKRGASQIVEMLDNCYL